MSIHIRRIPALLKESLSEWSNDNAARLAAALAFYTILSIAPLIIICTALAGFIFGEEAASGRLVDELRGLLGDAGAEVARTALMSSADKPRTGILATLFGVASLLFGASGVFGELQSALNTIWNVRPKPGRGVWRTLKDRFLSFGMVLVVGFLLLVSLIVSTALAAVGDFIGQASSLGPYLLQIVNFCLSLGGVTALFAMIYKVLPDVKIAWRDVWIGAIMTSILFTIGKLLIGLYLGNASIAGPFGAAGSLVVFVVWIYYSAIIVFYGAELTQVTMKELGRAIEPAEGAQPASRADSSARV